jgi:transcriptional regulator with XRE-family HTH domain
MTFPERLRALRDSAGLSEAKLAEASGVSFAAIHEYGMGRRKPSFEAVVKLARALGVDCTAFADCVNAAGEEPSAPGRKGGKDRGKPDAPPADQGEAEPPKRPRKGKGGAN